MIITRAPVRISLAGGGTDLPAYYEQFGGAVISTTITKYFYVFLSVSEEDLLQISSSDYRTFYRHDGRDPLLLEDDLILPRTILDYFGVEHGLGIFLASEIPPGTGLGSSSTVTVAILKGISAALGRPLDKSELAELACYIELEKLGKPIGKQDQYAAAFGGLNWIEFEQKGVRVEPLRLPMETVHQLEQNLLLFFTGFSRSASEILEKQTLSSKKRERQVIDALHRVKAMAYDVRAALEQGDLHTIGKLLHENWEQKKKFAEGISSTFIDDAYEQALSAGAVGGKITGAGGGGFLMLYCEPQHQTNVTEILEQMGLRRMGFRFDNMGARVLMNAGLQLSSSSKKIFSQREKSEANDS